MKYNRKLRRKLLKKMALDPKGFEGLNIQLPEATFEEPLQKKEILDDSSKNAIIEQALSNVLDSILDNIEKNADPEFFK
jgi:hypothetical protein